VKRTLAGRDRRGELAGLGLHRRKGPGRFDGKGPDQGSRGGGGLGKRDAGQRSHGIQALQEQGPARHVSGGQFDDPPPPPFGQRVRLAPGLASWPGQLERERPAALADGKDDRVAPVPEQVAGCDQVPLASQVVQQGGHGGHPCPSLRRIYGGETGGGQGRQGLYRH
jgi:hypothetical protein